jgi:hypothetical protein
MIQKIKNKLLILASLFMMALPLAVPAAALADCTAGGTGGSDCIQGGLCHGAQDLDVTAGQQACTPGSTGNSVSDLVKKIINILSVVVGVVAVIMIIIAGFRYITSGGKQESVTAAKNTILYAIIGLVIVALAQIIVRFVLTKTTTTG